MRDLIGNLIIFSGIMFVFIGVAGIYRFKNFYSRALMAANVDTVGYITLMMGVIVKQGLSLFSLKVFFILVITLIVNPLVSHAIVRSAYISGYKIGKE
ncbi:MAG: monovalent cation/H(+) antiporter subunit G [Proteocatella sp.]